MDLAAGAEAEELDERTPDGFEVVGVHRARLPVVV
jgi:hypothetical protein